MANCIHYRDRLSKLKQKITDSNKIKDDYEELIQQLESAKPLLESFSSSLLYIGYYLKHVVINDLAFDKGECKTQATKVDEIVNLLNKLISECNDKIEELTKEINKKKAKYKALKAEPCAECIENLDSSHISTFGGGATMVNMLK